MNNTKKEETNPYKQKREAIRKEKRKPYIIGAVCLCLILLFVFAGLSLSGDDIRDGVSINGLDVSGMSVDAAEKSLKTHLENTDFTITLTFADVTSEFSSRDIVLEYKIKDAANEAHALGRNKNFISDFFKIISLKLKGENIYAKTELNIPLITEYLDLASKAVASPVIENSYILTDGKLKFENGTKGNSLNRDMIFKEIQNAVDAGKNRTITLTEYEKEPDAFDVNKIYDDFAHPPKNADIHEENGKKYITEAENGYDFDKSALSEFLNNNKSNTEPYYFDLTVLEPEITKVNTDMFFKDVLSSYTSKITDSNASRLANVRLAAEKINGVILNPGEEFRYLSYIEPITAAGGYKVANVYSNGRVEQDIGGGVCQVSSALYSAVLYADLEVTRRYNHSLTVQYVPLGQDATVSSGELDFRFRNNTNEPVKVKTSFTYSGITASILGKKVDPDVTIEIENVTRATNNYETIITEDPALKPGEIVTDVNGKTGYVIDTYKHYYKGGKCIKTDYMGKSRYKTVNREQRKGPDTAEVISPEIGASTESTAKPSSTPSATKVPAAEITPEPAATLVPLA